jgi:membrane protein required for colicin V production
LNALDWIFVVMIALLAIRCAFKGLVAEVLSVAGVLAGLLAGLFLYKTGAGLFISWGLKPKPEIFPDILGFAAAFLLAFLIVKLVERLLEEGIQAAELGGVDRALGFVLGLAEGLLLVALLLVVLNLAQPALSSIPGYAKLLQGSLFARLILPVVGPELSKATGGLKIGLPSAAKP